MIPAYAPRFKADQRLIHKAKKDIEQIEERAVRASMV